MNHIVGQKGALKTLRSSLASDRLHHAWVFAGPRGGGKCTTALGFGAEILGATVAGNNPDLHLICKEDVVWAQNPALQKRKQTNIPIDLLRERMIGGKTSDGKSHDSVAFKTPRFGNKKVFIVDEAELLDEAGQNALLKTLEEPPAGTIIILVTSREDVLLQTILSRCQQVSFSPLSKLDMEQWAEQSSFDFNNDLSWALACSSGSPGVACDIFDTKLGELRENISAFLLLQTGYDYVVATQHIIQFIDSCVLYWTKQNSNTSKESANRRAFVLVLLMFSLSARLGIRGVGGSEGECNIGVLASDILVDTEAQLVSNVSIKVLVESLAARWGNLSAGKFV